MHIILCNVVNHYHGAHDNEWPLYPKWYAKRHEGLCNRHVYNLILSVCEITLMHVMCCSQRQIDDHPDRVLYIRQGPLFIKLLRREKGPIAWSLYPQGLHQVCYLSYQYTSQFILSHHPIVDLTWTLPNPFYIWNRSLATCVRTWLSVSIKLATTSSN